MSELKPCPFCGGKANIYKSKRDGKYIVECHILNECDVFPVTKVCDTEEKAIETWNRRVSE